LTDSEKGQRELRELERLVAAAFADPGSAAPYRNDSPARPQIRLWEEPSFTNPRCWAVWGPARADNSQGLVRRIVWRRDLDGDRGNPMRRLERLESPLHPTLEVSDGLVNLIDLETWVKKCPTPRLPESTMQQPRSFHVDGEWYGLDVINGRAKWRYEWFGMDTNWKPLDPSHEALARWAIRFRAWLDSRLEGDVRSEGQ
jgi:hypothetical protein